MMFIDESTIANGNTNIDPDVAFCLEVVTIYESERGFNGT